MDSLKSAGRPLTLTDVETNGQVQIFCTPDHGRVKIRFAFGDENAVEFILDREDFAAYIEFLTFNQTRLAATFKQPDGQYIGLSKRRENSVTEMTFEPTGSAVPEGEGKSLTISLEQNSVGDLIDYMSAAQI